MTCCICLENLDSNIKTIDCNHQFHTDCINAVKVKREIKCPLCRSVTIEPYKPFQKFSDVMTKDDIIAKFREYYKVLVLELKIIAMSYRVYSDGVDQIVSKLNCDRALEIFCQFADNIRCVVECREFELLMFLLCDMFEADKDIMTKHMQIYKQDSDMIFSYFEKLLYLANKLN